MASGAWPLRKREQLVAQSARSWSSNSAMALLVTLPLERALGCLRLVADQAELEVVQRILRGSVIDEQAWQKRLRVAREKVVDGTPVGLAEGVRDRACREARTRGGRARFSTAEHGLYQKARQLLA